MNEIVLESSYTVENYIRTHIYLQKRIRPSPIIINFGGSFIGVIALLNLFIVYDAYLKGDSEKAVGLTFVGLAVFSFMFTIVWIFNFTLQMRRYKKAVRKRFDRDSAASASRRIVLDEKGLSEEDRFGSRLMNWESIIGLIETEDDFYFFMPSDIRFLPKRWLAEKQLEPLKNLIKSNLREDAERRFQTAKT
ncbi:MAG: YcxB family protein [Acidobacteria bacterium]|nr:YcxB family protein [Acidobacteriota bacterium]